MIWAGLPPDVPPIWFTCPMIWPCKRSGRAANSGFDCPIQPSGSKQIRVVLSSDQTIKGGAIWALPPMHTRVLVRPRSGLILAILRRRAQAFQSRKLKMTAKDCSGVNTTPHGKMLDAKSIIPARLVVPLKGLEPPTPSLRMTCSTI
jgi:hypothetical protein